MSNDDYRDGHAPIPLEDGPLDGPSRVMHQPTEISSVTKAPSQDDGKPRLVVEKSAKIHSFAGRAKVQQDKEYHRDLLDSGHGATRVRTFHAKLTDGALHFLDDQINEWLDEHNEIEVKFATTVMGSVEGKQRTEPHLIVSIWY